MQTNLKISNCSLVIARNGECVAVCILAGKYSMKQSFSSVRSTILSFALSEVYGYSASSSQNEGTARNEKSGTVQDNTKSPQLRTARESQLPRDLVEEHRNSVRNRIAQVAKSYEGSDDWLFSTAKGEYGANTNKCNLFVYDVLSEAGVTAPQGVYGHIPSSGPLLAGDWANPDVNVSGWRVLGANETPLPGDIAAKAMAGGSNYSGHVGIVVSGNQTMSASSNVLPRGRITRTGWGFKIDESYTYRRYVGIPLLP